LGGSNFAGIKQALVILSAYAVCSSIMQRTDRGLSPYVSKVRTRWLRTFVSRLLKLAILQEYVTLIDTRWRG
jgi:hypothetical protein